MAIARLQLETTALLVIDMQVKLLAAMHEPAAFTRQVARLIDGANALKLPVLVTEQYRKGLGATAPELAGKLTGALCCVDKLKFSGCVEEVRDTLAASGARAVIVCGIEAHVCVLQTCLDLASLGYVTALAVDAVGSRRPVDRKVAVARLVQAGIVPTTVESALFELAHEAGSDRFRAILPLVR